MTIEDRIVEDDKIAHQMRVQGTHEGEFIGMEPKGNEFDITTFVIHHFEDRKGVPDYLTSNMMGRMQQLGVLDLPTE